MEDYIERIKAKEVTIEQIEQAFIQARDIGCHAVKFTGGEPLLRDDTPELMRWMHAHGFSITMETNGTLIDEKIIQVFKETKLRHVAISLDAPEAAIHDKLRGQPGAFEAAVRGIRLAVRAGLSVQIIMSLYTDNEHLLEPMTQMAVELGVRSLKVNPVIPSGRALAVEKQGRIVPVERLMNYYRFCTEILVPKYRMTIHFSIPTGLKTFKEITTNSAECHIHNICGLMGNGDVSICGIGRTEPELVTGNIKTGDIREMWIKGSIFQTVRRDIPDQMQGICAKCIFKAKCKGSCVAVTYSLSGQLNQGYWFCEEAEKLGLFPASRKFC